MDEPPIQARYLLLCREVVFDPLDEITPYSLRGVYTTLRPDEVGYPLCCEMIWAYTEVFGEPGRYLTRIEYHRLADDESPDGPARTVFDSRPVRIRPGAFVEGARFQLFHAAFPEGGLYEFQLFLEGYVEPLATQRVYLSEV